MAETEQKGSRWESFWVWYDKYYRHLLIFPAALLVLATIYLGFFISQTGDIVGKDVSLTGGTTITVFESDVSPGEMTDALQGRFPDITVRAISDFRTRQQQAIILETSAEPDEIRPALEDFLGYPLTQENSSIEFTGAALSQGFYQQLRLAVIFAFVFMAVVVFIIFRTPIPSLAVIISAFADIVLTVVIVNLFGIELSIAGIVALLMLIGYSVDTDIMLTSRVLRRKEHGINKRMFDAFKTGMTMTLTSIVALTIALIVIFNFSDVLRQIFTILLIGLVFDIFNTWVTNASLLKWHAHRKGIV